MKSAKTVTSNADDMARQGGVVASMTLLSRISGLMRDVVLSYLFGASQLADMFFVAFRIPNFFRLLFADCLLYTSPSPRDKRQSRMPSSA